jgi:methyl-accepting chemotaxis protein
MKAAENAGEVINGLIPQIEKTAELVQEITSASQEQSKGAEQINAAIQQLDTVIQQNASASEEMASMSEELNGQSDMMKDNVSYFTLDSHGSTSAQYLPAPEVKTMQHHVAHIKGSPAEHAQKNISQHQETETAGSTEGFEEF